MDRGYKVGVSEKVQKVWARPCQSDTMTDIGWTWRNYSSWGASANFLLGRQKASADFRTNLRAIETKRIAFASSNKMSGYKKRVLRTGAITAYTPARSSGEVQFFH